MIVKKGKRYMNTDKIIIRGLRQNNLKNISLEIPKEKIVVFTGVSGSGKSSIVFDTVAAESQRQMNETYTAFMRGRLPKYEKQKADYIDNLTASYFSFNDPKGMCPECYGIGKVLTVNVESRIDPEKTWNEGMADLDAFHVGNYYWKRYAQSGVIPLDKKYKDFT